MSNVIGCVVAPFNKDNSATLPLENATQKATSNSTEGLIALATRALARHQCNKADNLAATGQLHAHAIPHNKSMSEKSLKKSCTVAISKEGNYATVLKKVMCDNCEHFMPDEIGDGAGIGDCGLGIKYTQEVSGLMPLFRYADRHCDNFSKLMSKA
jgi:hypothetical protein